MIYLIKEGKTVTNIFKDGSRDVVQLKRQKIYEQKDIVEETKTTILFTNFFGWKTLVKKKDILFKM